MFTQVARTYENGIKQSQADYEVDVPYEDRYLVDRVDEIPEYKMRKLFIDLEALQFNDTDAGPHHYSNRNNPRDFKKSMS